MERQVQIEQRWERAGTRSVTLFQQGFFPACVGTKTRGAADGGVLSFTLPVEHDLCGGIIFDFFVRQEGHQTVLQGAKTAFDLAFGLRAGSDQMGDPERGKSALELGARVPVIRHGIMPKEAEAVGVHDHGQEVLEKESSKMFKVIPGGVGGDKDRAQQFA